MIMLLALLAAAQPMPQDRPPRLCRTVHGRMYAANGNPAIRIWVVGTRRVLGVGSQDDVSLNDLPANVRRAWTRESPTLTHARVYGDFRVCAWRPQRPGEMQMVRVVSARNLVVEPWE